MKYISVETEDGRNELCTISENKPLDDTIKDLCNRFSLPSDKIYALKIWQTNDGKVVDNYITNENYDNIKDGYSLKIVYSLDIFINRIFDNLNNYGREKGFNDLRKLSSDPAFIKELVNKEKHKVVIDLLLNEDLKGIEMEACLTTLFYLIQKNYIREFSESVLNKLITIAVKSEFEAEHSENALAVLCQILYLRGREFDNAKSYIISNVSFKELMPYIWSEEHPNLQLNTLTLINAIVKCVSGEKRSFLIKEMNLKQNRDAIYKCIIKNKPKRQMAHQLYVYQTYLLSLYDDDLRNLVDKNQINIFKDDFELSADVLRPISNLIDFEDFVQLNRSDSTETVLDDSSNHLRFSIASVSTRGSIATYDSEISLASSASQENIAHNKLCISRLAMDGLCYYKKYYEKTFQHSFIEENFYTPGIYKTSEKVTQILAKLLHIGREPVKHCDLYQPLIFDGNMKNSFFMELFARTMWLLSKTRREMKVSTSADYKKVLKVLEEQIVMVLKTQPVTYDSLTNEIRKISYDDVAKHWQSQKENKWQTALANNPSIQEFKKQVTPYNEELVYKQRMAVLKAGEKFPKLGVKKQKAYFFIQLSENERNLFYGDWDETLEQFSTKELETFCISNIRYFIVGTACPHVKDNSVKDYKLAFTICLEDGNIINFCAKDEKTAHYWIDGFHLLLGKSIRSKSYIKELEMLVKMDCTLQLLELQNIKIPDSPPEIPPVPPAFKPKPTIPPKPDLKKKVKRNPK